LFWYDSGVENHASRPSRGVCFFTHLPALPVQARVHHAFFADSPQNPMTPQPDKRRVLKSLVALARRTRRTPSRREFLANSGISESAVSRLFPNWNSAVRAAGLKPHTQNQRLDDRQLLEDWGRAARKNHKIPSRRLYSHLGTFDHRTVARHFGRWSQLPEAFRRFAQGKPQWADVLDLLPPPRPTPNSQPPSTPTPVLLPATFTLSLEGRNERNGAKGFGMTAVQPKTVPAATIPTSSFSAPDNARPLRPSPVKIRHPHLPGRPIYGQPMDFRGLRHEPVNEQGVVLLFGMVAKELGYIVEAVQSGFPDCEAKRQIAPERWQRVHLEFEFESRNFRGHGHPLTGCDVIVCWRHNWPDCPEHLEILELSSLIHSLPDSAP
jgi:hypothetical protein